MKVSALMKADPRTVTEDCTLKEAAAIMQEVDTGVLPVVEGDKNNPGKKPIGVLTDRDIVVRCISNGKDPKTAKVSEAYTADTVFCDEDDTEKEAFEKMRKEGIGRILVKSQNDTLAGIISMGDILTNLPESVWECIGDDAANANQDRERKRAM